jgi:glucan phosphoethanolaminetransferase (alkaline phosphatase superfamily)
MSSTYKNNHIRLMRFHIGLGVMYLCLAVLITLLMNTPHYLNSPPSHGKDKIFVIAVIIYMFIAVHLVLSIGSGKRLEWSRKVSEMVGIMLCFAIPIGPFLGYFLLQRTLWKTPENASDE